MCPATSEHGDKEKDSCPKNVNNVHNTSSQKYRQISKDGFPQTKLTHENFSTTEKEGKKYTYLNRVFTNKINPQEFVQSKISNLQTVTVILEKPSSFCPGFFLSEILISVSFGSLQCRWLYLLFFLPVTIQAGEQV